MLDVTSLVQDHLTQSFKVFELTGLKFDTFSEPSDVLGLLFDHLLGLETQQFFFFLEVRHDLRQTLLQKLYLRLQHLDLVILLILLFGIFLDGLLFLLEVILILFILSS